MQKEYLSYDDIHDQVKNISFQVTVSGWKPTVVVGISRGGLLPATLLSHTWNVPMKSFNLSLRDQQLFLPDSADWLNTLARDGHRILVVDDINDTGSTVGWIREDWGFRWSKMGLDKDFTDHIKFATLVNKASSKQKVDFSCRQVPPDQDHIWWVFPWEAGA